MGKPRAMTSRPDSASFLEMKSALEDFLNSAENVALLENEARLLDLRDHQWRLSAEYNKLLLEIWNADRSFVWRIEEIVYRDRGRLILSVRKPGGGGASLELRETAWNPPAPNVEARGVFERDLLALLEERYPGWKFERVSRRSDREHAFSAWYTRGFARRGRAGWAFMGLSEAEGPEAGDSALAYGLNWLDWLREKYDDCVVSGLKLFLPSSAATLSAHRAAYLDPLAAEIEIFELSSPPGLPHLLDLKDFGNVATRLTPRRRAELCLNRHRGFLEGLLGDSLSQVDLLPDASGSALSLRVFGLEIARLQGEAEPQFYWGLEGCRRKYIQNHREDVKEFVRQAIALRRAGSSEPRHEMYRAQPECWLESVLVRDVSRLDPALRAERVYPQVPAFAGGDRGVVDILSVLRDGRLAVIELKLSEEITLPLQGLDYWLRVKWLNDRCQFQEHGYFQGVELSKAPPVLYLVCPAFRFHSTSQRIIRYLHPSVEVIQVGINQQWREKVKVLFRRRVHPLP